MPKKIFLLLFLINCLVPKDRICAQRITKQAADSLFRILPYFTIYKDNYFITGTTLAEKPTKYNSDVKYQVSFKQILTKNSLPFNTYLFLSYSQLAFWNVYQNSSPFAEINFNPSLGLAKRLFANDQLFGVATVVLEHESNGRDSTASRSWNRVSFSFQGPVFERAVMTLKAWIPFVDKESNPDLLQYVGYGEASMTYGIIPKKLLLDCTLRKGSSWDWRGSAQTQVDYRPFKNGNQYLTLQWFQGYGESLINYNVKVSMLRIGIIIKPPYLNLY